VTDAPRAALSVLVRPATQEDLDALARIESAHLSGTWSREAMADELAKSFARLRVAEASGMVCAFVHGWLIADELQILNVATDSAHRRRGVARALLRTFFEEARRWGARTALLEVRASNEAAIALYRSLGFNENAVRARYYSDGEDALLMSAKL
jgi:ribosomal-protein-alanine N-acetyltransferase